ncbi:MAG: hypothetical protein ACRDQ5_05165 [Sciscionella sp.]
MAVDGNDESPSTGTFTLRLRLGGTEAPSGTISVVGESATQPFDGWLELMSSINRLRGWETPAPDRDPPPDNPGPEYHDSADGDVPA